MNIKLHKYNCCDFSKVGSIGVLCRGKSLGSIGQYKDNFENIFVVGQHQKSFDIIGDHILGNNIVKVWGKTFHKPDKVEKSQCVKYNIKDMQTYLNPLASDRKSYKFKKLGKRHDGLLEVFSLPPNFLKRNKGYRSNGKLHHPTIGLFSVDLAAAYKPKEIHIIGLDFYHSHYLVQEKKHISAQSNKNRTKSMMRYFNFVVSKEKDVKFYLYTCCRDIKSTSNLKVIKI